MDGNTDISLIMKQLMSMSSWVDVRSIIVSIDKNNKLMQWLSGIMTLTKQQCSLAIDDHANLGEHMLHLYVASNSMLGHAWEWFMRYEVALVWCHKMDRVRFVVYEFFEIPTTWLPLSAPPNRLSLACPRITDQNFEISAMWLGGVTLTI